MAPILPPETPAGAHLAGIPYPHADLLGVADALPENEQQELQKLHEFLQSDVRPVVGDYWDREEFPFELLPALAEHGLGEVELSDKSPLFRGLVYTEVARADISVSVLVGIHNELILGILNQAASPEQQERWIPGLRTFEKTACFALTEPDHGSDVAGGLSTTAQRTENGWVINGRKRWIGGGTFADIAIVFARDVDDKQVKGFIVELDRDGVTAEKISGKLALRAMQNADMTFDQVEIPAENAIPGIASFNDLNTFLCNSRALIGWQGAGLQLAVFDKAREYAVTRHQFGRPIAGFQLVQEPLARILGNANASLAMMSQIASVQERGQLDMPMAALVKATVSRLTRESAAEGRNIAGGNGILTENELSKLMGDAEAVYTYEGTYQVNSLIVGRAVTGQSAFV